MSPKKQTFLENIDGEKIKHWDECCKLSTNKSNPDRKPNYSAKVISEDLIWGGLQIKEMVQVKAEDGDDEKPTKGATKAKLCDPSLSLLSFCRETLD